MSKESQHGPSAVDQSLEVMAEAHAALQARLVAVEAQVAIIAASSSDKDQELSRALSESRRLSERLDFLDKELRAIRYLLSETV